MRTDKFKLLFISILVSLVMASCGGGGGGGSNSKDKEDEVVIDTIAVPVNSAQSVQLLWDTDADEDQITGTLSITKAADESDLDSYVLYWGSNATTKQNTTPITTIAKTGSNLTYSFVADTAVPSGATHLLVYTVNADGEMATPKSLDIPDNVTKMVYNPATALNPQYMTVFNGKLFFSGYDTTYGTELWMYDGTDNPVAGTNIKMHSDVWNIGTNSGMPKHLAVNGSYLYFQAWTGGAGTGYELYKCDGTTTTAAANVWGGVGDGLSSTPEWMYSYNSKIFFAATDATVGRELFSFDGTTAINEADIYAGSTNNGFDNVGSPISFKEYNSKLYFNARDASGVELWCFDDATNVTTEYDLNVSTGTASSTPNSFEVYNGKLYFGGTNGITFGSCNGNELWYVDGNNAPQIFNIRDDSTAVTSSTPKNLTVFNGKLYMSLNGLDSWPSGAITGSELYAWEGSTSVKPALVKDINPGNANGITSNGEPSSCMIVCNNKLYFRANDGTNGAELWVYDGTNDPVMVKDIYPGAAANNGLQATSSFYPAVMNNKLYFVANDGTYGNELWVHYIK